MTYIGRLIFNTTGVMSNRGLVKNSTKIGERIVETMKQNSGNITPNDVKQIITDTVGKKASKKISILNSKEEALAFNRENNICSDESFEATYNEVLGFSASERYRRRSMLLVKDKEEIAKSLGDTPSTLIESMVPNTLAHEIQHSLSSSSGFYGLPKVIGKFSWGRKFIDKQQTKFIELNMQDKYLELQDFAFELARKGVSKDEFITSMKELMYTKGILKPGDNKNNAFMLSEFKSIFKDEQRSYTVGNRTTEVYYGTSIPDLNKVVDIYKNLTQAISQEQRHIRLNRIKSFLGFKPNYQREENIIEYARLKEKTADIKVNK